MQTEGWWCWNWHSGGGLEEEEEHGGDWNELVREKRNQRISGVDGDTWLAAQRRRSFNYKFTDNTKKNLQYFRAVNGSQLALVASGRRILIHKRKKLRPPSRRLTAAGPSTKWIQGCLTVCVTWVVVTNLGRLSGSIVETLVRIMSNLTLYNRRVLKETFPAGH